MPLGTLRREIVPAILAARCPAAGSRPAGFQGRGAGDPALPLAVPSVRRLRFVRQRRLIALRFCHGSVCTLLQFRGVGVESRLGSVRRARIGKPPGPCRKVAIGAGSRFQVGRTCHAGVTASPCKSYRSATFVTAAAHFVRLSIRRTERSAMAGLPALLAEGDSILLAGSLGNVLVDASQACSLATIPAGGAPAGRTQILTGALLRRVVPSAR